MPWHTARSDDCSPAKPWACIRDSDGSIEGCHETEEAAQAQVAALYASESSAMSYEDGRRHKSFELLEVKADDEEKGTFTALASVFGNVDHGGDRMVRGAFKKTLEKWRKSGKPIPVIWSHDWDDPHSTIGKADPRGLIEDKRGLLVQGKLDLENEKARQVHKLMREQLITGWSFGYKVPKGGQKQKDGVNEVTEVDLFEVGPTLVGMNPEAQLQEVKADSDDEPQSSPAIDPENDGPNEEPSQAKSRPDPLREEVEMTLLEATSGISKERMR